MTAFNSNQRPLRILHTESSIGWGGQEIRILSEIRGFMQRGHQVLLLTPESAEIFTAAQRWQIPVQALGIVKKRLPALRTVRAWLRHHAADYDLINTHSSTDSWLFALARQGLLHAPPMVRTRHVSTPVNRYPSTRWLYQQATAHVVTTGEALRQQLHRDNGLSLERLTSVRTGIDLQRFKPLPRVECRERLQLADRPTLGILATLRDWKGHDDLLMAWSLLRADFAEWQLLIVGDGPRRQHLEQKVQALNLHTSVQFVGNQDNVPDWLNAMDLFVLPSFGDEGVPQGLMQAMACGVPAVSTPVGAIAEALQDEKTGLMVPAREPQVLAAALARLMANPSLRQVFGSASLSYAQDHFGIDIMLNRMEAVFRRVLEKQQGRR